MKKINSEVKDYIINCIEFTDENEEFNYKLNDKEKIIKIYAQFRNELYHLPPTQQSFIDWLQGLPTNFNIDFTCYEHEKLLITWFGKNVTDFNHEVDMTDYFYSIIADQFFKLYVHACYAL